MAATTKCSCLCWHSSRSPLPGTAPGFGVLLLLRKFFTSRTQSYLSQGINIPVKCSCCSFFPNDDPALVLVGQSLCCASDCEVPHCSKFRILCGAPWPNLTLPSAGGIGHLLRVHAGQNPDGPHGGDGPGPGALLPRQPPPPGRGRGCPPSLSLLPHPTARHGTQTCGHSVCMMATVWTNEYRQPRFAGLTNLLGGDWQLGCGVLQGVAEIIEFD